jgi:hypothetical protein
MSVLIVEPVIVSDDILPPFLTLSLWINSPHFAPEQV